MKKKKVVPNSRYYYPQRAPRPTLISKSWKSGETAEQRQSDEKDERRTEKCLSPASRFIF